MGRVVGGFGVSHVLFPPDGVEAQADRVIEGLLAMRGKLRALAPDVVVLASSDHLNNFNLAQQVTLAVGVADEFATLGDGGAPEARFRGHRPFAEGFVRFAGGRDFDLVAVEEARPDHGMAIPRLALDPAGELLVVPLWINCNMPIPPSPARCWRLGRALKEYVETERPSEEHVVVVGAGGLSHWLCLPEQGRVAAEFDEDFIARIIGAEGEALARLSAADIVAAAGNGGLELTAWLFMAGALEGARGEKLFYEPIPQWISGMGGVALRPATP